MPRIRTIKPQFWDDEKIAKLSIPARLMFIGTWNFADDHGILLWDSTYIKSKVFPLDKYSLRQIQGFMDELIRLKFVRKYKIRRGDTYAVIPHFLDHQVINRPQSSTKPHPKWLQSDNKVDTEQQQGEIQTVRNLDTEGSLNKHGMVTDDSRQGKEGRGGEGKGKNT